MTPQRFSEIRDMLSESRRAGVGHFSMAPHEVAELIEAAADKLDQRCGNCTHRVGSYCDWTLNQKRVPFWAETFPPVVKLVAPDAGADCRVWEAKS